VSVRLEETDRTRLEEGGAKALGEQRALGESLVLKVCGDRELSTEGVESGRVWTELSECVVLGELSEECTRGRAGGAHVAREAREARGSRNARGSRSARCTRGARRSY